MTISPSSRRYLEALIEELSIGDKRYEQANESYQSLGKWLSRPESSIHQFSPMVYIQGSFGLGTVIKPINLDEEYDIDAVCELKGLSKSELTQERLKAMLGYEIEAYRKSKSMVKPLREGRRCWTLNYADGAQFHMDIVPALPDGQSFRKMLEERRLNAQWSENAIAITDNELHNYRQMTLDWPRSNPKGYLEWFKSRMITVLNERKERLAKSLNASVEKIPDYRVQTPLQAAIMILKRHRDIMFEKDNTNSAPISIIITTLAAHAYSGERDIADALSTILSGMHRFIERDQQGMAIIRNPSDPTENFADKWPKHPERERAFNTWLARARDDFAKIASLASTQSITETMAPRLGEVLAKRAGDRSRASSGSLLRGAVAPSSAAPSFDTTPRVPSKPQGFA